MDAALQTALRSLREEFTVDNCQRYAVALVRTGADAIKAMHHLQDIYGEALKAILLEALPQCSLPDAKFIVHDSSLEVLDDYQGHIVEKPAIELGHATSQTALHKTYIVYLTSTGIYLFDRATTRRQLSYHTQKISGCERTECPVWESRIENMEGYVKFTDIALYRMKQLTEERNKSEPSPWNVATSDDENLPF